MKSQLKKMLRRFLSKNGQSAFKLAQPSEFVSWLKFANAGMLNNGNLYCLEYAIEHLPSNKPIIEIGSFCGLSTNLINYYLRKNKRSNKLITCDKWHFEGAKDLEGGIISRDEYRQFVKDTYIRNISFFSKDRLPFTIEEFSDDFFKMWEDKKEQLDILGRPVQLGGEISFAFIDGNHTYQYARRDFENVDKFLERGGFILFDDSGDGSGWEVNQVVQEIKKGGDYEVIARNPNYLIKKIK